MKCAIVGLGNQGRKRSRVASQDVVATVDPVAPDVQFRQIEAVPLDSYQAALVCTPDNAKVPAVRYLLSHGKHVLVEKPLLASPDEFDELSELARHAGVACYTAYNHRFEPHLVRVKDVLDHQVLGSLYLVRMFYGNGTARDVRNSPWRDQGMGVLADLGSHLLDLVAFFFRLEGRAFSASSIDRFENRAPDHVLFGSNERPILVLEGTMVSWRNSFQLDIFGDRGSLHVNGLCKWGPSIFTLRKRILPSGRPEEETVVLESPDPTWEREYQHFQDLCTRPDSNLNNDRQIQAALEQVMAPAGGVRP